MIHRLYLNETGFRRALRALTGLRAIVTGTGAKPGPCAALAEAEDQGAREPGAQPWRLSGASPLGAWRDRHAGTPWPTGAAG